MWRTRFAYWLGADPSGLARRYEGGAAAERRALPTLQIFAKAPVLGTVKTRLAAVIGAQEALALYTTLTERTLDLAAAARGAGIVGQIELWCAPDAAHPAFAAWRDRVGATLHVQEGDGLGARMQHALVSATATGTSAVLIGTDCPALALTHLAQATGALANNDAVLAPAEDGGYVLVGLARSLSIFDDIAWGSASVMSATRERLAQQGARWTELPTLWDVDTAQDLARWRAMDDTVTPSRTPTTRSPGVPSPIRCAPPRAASRRS